MFFLNSRCKLHDLKSAEIISTRISKKSIKISITSIFFLLSNFCETIFTPFQSNEEAGSQNSSPYSLKRGECKIFFWSYKTVPNDHQISSLL